MLSITNFSNYPIVGIYMPSYEVKQKQTKFHDFSIIIAINTKSEVFVFDLTKDVTVKILRTKC